MQGEIGRVEGGVGEQAAPHLPIHGDVHADNFRFVGDRVAALLDFDQAEWEARRKGQLLDAHAPAITRDGHTVEVVVNIGGAEDARLGLENGAEGVGLFRTEFLYLDRETMPTEAEQIAAYRSAFKVMAGKTMVVRTLDIGGDKSVPCLLYTSDAADE